MRGIGFAFAAILITSACAPAPVGQPSPAAQATLAITAAPPPSPTPRAPAEIARAGALRFGMNTADFYLTAKDAASGEFRGPAPEVGRELARRIAVSFSPFEFAGYPQLSQLLKGAGWDVAVVFADPATPNPQRDAEVDLSEPVFEVDLTYLVPGASRIAKAADADQPRITISVVRGSNADAITTRLVKRATIVRTDSLDGAFSLVRDGKADAFASIRPRLLLFSDQLPGSRVLPDGLETSRWHLVVPKGRSELFAFVKDFLTQAKASGLLRQLVERGGGRGVSAAPATTPGY